MRPLAGQARQVVLDLGQFHLQTALARAGTLAEDDEDERGAVKHLRLQLAFQRAVLPRRQFQIEDDGLAAVIGDEVGNLLHLAGAEQRAGIDLRQPRQHAPDAAHTGSSRQLFQFFQRFFRRPIGVLPVLPRHINADEDGRLRRPREQAAQRAFLFCLPLHIKTILSCHTFSLSVPVDGPSFIARTWVKRPLTRQDTIEQSVCGSMEQGNGCIKGLVSRSSGRRQR